MFARYFELLQNYLAELFNEIVPNYLRSIINTYYSKKINILM